MLVASLGFAAMAALVKLGANKFSAPELVFYRSFFGLVVIGFYVFNQQLPLSSPVLVKQLSRACWGFLSLVLFFYAIAHLPLATAITLNYTSPMFLALLITLHLKEKPKHISAICLVVGFIGITILLKPSFSRDEWFATSMGLLSGIGAAIAYLHVKQLGHAKEPDWRTVFYFTLVSTIGAGIWMCVSTFQPLAWADIPMLLGLGIAATIGQLAMTRAYRTGDTLVVASLAYSTVLFASLLGIWCWNEQLSLDAWFAIGLIVVSGIISVRHAPK